MKNELVINTTSNGVEIALLQDKALVELHREQKNQQYAVGDIYLGKVRKVIPSLNAAFVDVGYERDAFLHYLDLGAQFSSSRLYAKRVMARQQKTPNLDDFKMQPDINKHGKIKDELASSQTVLVQVAKEPISAKGPRLTAEITIPGRYVVLVPFSSKISLSQRITNEAERDRLRRLMKSIRPPGFGIIVRTVAENKGAAALHSDLEDLVERWKLLYKNLQTAKPQHRVLGELNKTSTILRDLLTPEFSTIHLNDEALALEVKEFLKNIAPDKEGIVRFVKSKDMFDSMGLHKQIKSSFGKQVNLQSGAYLIIEHTEAMHVIDVNSGGRKGGVKNQEENALQTNLECAVEIARVLRLRDMGGIICIDFIDMHERANQRALHEAMTAAMKDDKAKHNILPPSKFGVIEITRQRVREVTDIKTSEKCPSCDGKGVVEAPLLFTDNLESKIRFIAEEGKNASVTMLVHPIIEAYLTKGWFNSLIRTWRKKYKMHIKLEDDSSLEFLENHIYDTNGVEVVI